MGRPGRGCAFIVAMVILPSCAPLPKAEYWDGYFRHLHPPRYTFKVPDGWREATPSDSPALGFNRDTSLMSSRGAWIQVRSQTGPGGWYAFQDLRFGLSDRERQAIWQRVSTSLIQAAAPAERPTLTLESLDLEDYGENRVLRLRFTAEAPRGSMHWTVLEFYGSSGAVIVAHVGTPRDRDEGLAALEKLSFRFD